MNAIGLNPMDSKFYGSVELADSVTYLCRFGEGKIELLGTLPGWTYAAGFDSEADAFYYKTGQKIYVVKDLAAKEAFSSTSGLSNLGTEVSTVSNDDFHDIVVLTTDAGTLGSRKLLLGLLSTGSAYVLDVTDGSDRKEWILKARGLENVANTPYGAGWVYEGHVYFGSNSGAGVVQLLLNTIDDVAGEMEARVYAGKSGATQSNDGANCFQEPDPFASCTGASCDSAHQ
eukprot:5853050-Amphidinium_carterae.1